MSARHLFIAWATREGRQVATGLEKAMLPERWVCSVGGTDETVQGANDYMGPRVLAEMNRSERAVVLVGPFDKGQVEFRPNLMWEWGLLRGRLPANRLHVYLLDVKVSDLPSDLLGSTPEMFSSESGDFATQIAADLRRRLCALDDFDPCDALLNWYEWKREIRAACGETTDHPPTEEWLFAMLPHSIQSAVYFSDLSWLHERVRTLTSRYRHSQLLLPVLTLVGCACEYYLSPPQIGTWSAKQESPASAENLAKDPGVASLSLRLTEARRDLDEAYERVRRLLPEDAPVQWRDRWETRVVWARVIFANFLGLSLPHAEKESANAAFKEAKALLESGKLGCGLLVSLWKGFVYFNLARRAKKPRALLAAAVRERGRALAFAQAEGSGILWTRLLLELAYAQAHAGESQEDALKALFSSRNDRKGPGQWLAVAKSVLRGRSRAEQEKLSRLLVFGEPWTSNADEPLDHGGDST